ncbi:Protein of unknown function [Planifilum fulgidum]|uniref:DUF3907 domain-containing protein n=1 Tax=Planifilum fulgidum TaxID=201973 RepID=A0A1I2RZ79_9BACL|nr:DUF3907 family protein [Planifilum fulgidum]MBO2497885.1 DUF3907 domain-containing protein [Bacillota bacterium]MBO2533241.1 DUF3907 domain-containing protein [Thermoactinomycetaceae bacterium]SFG43056.1 Protein of unknown function [Planifilum fulgidum]
MPAEQTKQLCRLAKDRLKEAIRLLEDFLNYTHIPRLMEETPESEKEGMEEYYREYLSDLRVLLVSCQVAYEKVSLVLRRATFKREFAEKVLSEIVHGCIYNFYYPRNEVYEEDGRYCYTQQEAIKFRRQPAESLRKLTIDLSRIFEILRDELDYYETDYITRLRMLKMD